MSGPVLAIELAAAISPTALQRLHELLLRTSARLEEKRVGEYDLHVRVEILGITGAAHVKFVESVMTLPGYRG
ncbi:hypothetical protein GBF35_00455 [Nonomuraea phyllanthi]|uniref:DUF6368 family protein n=1 Tax=Nonomuraea phyllanthi TaxID=2219224 RepID=UPI0012938AAA|nr:DUF6368 family protein [Nonomuraea phyllanthi]QFY05356.1 hypothetical protein GBF35_00455 [Nonomuraea phyllanthi]